MARVKARTNEELVALVDNFNREKTKQDRQGWTIRTRDINGEIAIVFDYYKRGETRVTKRFAQRLQYEIVNGKPDVSKIPANSIVLSNARNEFFALCERGLSLGNDLTIEQVIKLWQTECKSSSSTNEMFVNPTRKRLNLICDISKFKIKDVDTAFCRKFINTLCQTKVLSYLGSSNTDRTYSQGLKQLSKNTRSRYFATFSCVLQYANEKDFIPFNPISKLSRLDKSLVAPEEGKREYLTEDEVQRLIDTPCKYETVKKAFLFGVFSGLRCSDLQTLTWGNIPFDNGVYRIVKQAVKTGKLIYNKIPASGLHFLPERNGASDNDLVFVGEGWTSSETINKTIKNWCKAAGITKHITMHCSRHSTGTLLLNKGVSLDAIQSILQHSNIATTQIYAKLLDKTKDDAIDSFDKLNINIK